MLLLASASPTFAETTIPTTNINSGNDLDVDECSFGNVAIGLELDADDAGTRTRRYDGWRRCLMV
jgi:hypothetical protein